MGWIIVIAIAAWIFYTIGKSSKQHNNKKFQSVKTDLTEEVTIKHSEQASSEPVEDKEVEHAARIRNLAKKKEEEAKKRGLDDLVLKVFDETKHFPSWIEKGSEYVPKIVKSATYVDEKKHGDGYVLEINKNKYRIVETMGTGYELSDTYSDIEVFENDIKKFEVNSSIEYGEWLTKYHPFSIKAYKDGQWIQDFERLLQAIDNLKKERERKKLIDEKELNELKENFDID